MRFLGHPVHPMFVHFPIVLWTIATAAYVSVAAGAGEPAMLIAKLANAVGLIMAMLAMLAGALELRAIDKESEAILALKPVTFHYKSDQTNTPQFGLVAEEVAEVNPDLVVRDKNGEIYTVRYEAVNAMLLNEFLKEHRKVEQLTKDFQSKLAQQQKQIEALTAGLQKVSAQLELSKPAPQVVNNP